MEQIALLRADPNLAGDLSPRKRKAAERQLRVPEVELEAGPWEPPEDGPSGSVSYLMTDGMILRRVALEGGASVELLGAGDYLLPLRDEAASFSRAELEVIDRARLALLDMRPGAPLSRWPTIGTEIAGRAIDRSRSLALQSAIMSIVGIEERLHALLWSLAERWGRATPAGVELEVNVPQAVLAEMIGARRPTVSQALGNLCERDALVSTGPGTWVLPGEPPAPTTSRRPSDGA